MPRAVNAAIPTRLINEALARVLASQVFRGAARQCRFLEFVVRQTLDGHADQIKAFVIAIDVFDRDEGFDPVGDPVVRVQAGRVRQSLDRYYATEGATDPVRITIPKGRYVPHFVTRLDACGTADDTDCPDPGELGGRPVKGDANPAPAARTAPPVRSLRARSTANHAVAGDRHDESGGPGRPAAVRPVERFFKGTPAVRTSRLGGSTGPHPAGGARHQRHGRSDAGSPRRQLHRVIGRSADPVRNPTCLRHRSSCPGTRWNDVARG